MARLAPGLATLLAYRASDLRHDLTAGLSVAAVAVPVGVAYAELAGFPPVVGLYASILPLVAYTLFDIGELYVIASHHGRDAKAEGTWVAQTKTSCPSGWTGVITYDEVHDDFSSVTDANGTTVEEDHVQHRQRWVLGGTTPGPQGDVVDVAWDGTWQKHHSLRHAPSSGCVGQVTYGRVSGAGVGSGTDRITFVPIPGGWQTTPDFSIRQLEGTEDHFSQICTGASASSSEPIPLLVDQLFTAVFAAEDLALLQPATPEQKSFTGTKVLTHMVEPRPGGQSVLDVTIGWTLRKR